MLLRAFILPILLAATPLSAQAATSPPLLRGKSVQLSWTDNRVERIVSTDRTVTESQTSSVKLYASDKGRIFSQFDRSVGRGNTQKNDVSGAGKASLNWRTEGKTLVADQNFGGGARRIAISFDEAFSSCSLSIIHGKAGGRPQRYMNLAGTNFLELVSITVTSTSCSVQPGNAFGQ